MSLKSFKIPYWYLLVGPKLLENVGMFMNKITMAVNGGLMPVQAPGCNAGMFEDDPFHGCLTSASHLKVLCDWLNFHSSIDSLGDLTIDLSRFLLVPCLIIWATLMSVKHKEAYDGR